MFVYTRTITPKIGREAALAAGVAASMPAYAEMLGLPVNAYVGIGSGRSGQVEFVVVAESLEQLAASQRRQDEAPEMTEMVDAIRLENNEHESDQIISVAAVAPAGPIEPAPITWRIVARIDRTKIHEAVASAAEFGVRAVELGARFSMVGMPVSGPIAELHQALGFDDSGHLDRWLADLASDERAQAILTRAAAYTPWTSNDAYRAGLWSKLA